MFVMHCSKCQHEWETVIKYERCNWCGNIGYLMEEKKDFGDIEILEILKMLGETTLGADG